MNSLGGYKLNYEKFESEKLLDRLRAAHFARLKSRRSRSTSDSKLVG